MWIVCNEYRALFTPCGVNWNLLGIHGFIHSGLGWHCYIIHLIIKVWLIYGAKELYEAIYEKKCIHSRWFRSMYCV